MSKRKQPDIDDKKYLEIFIQTPCDSTITEEDIKSLFEKIITVSADNGVKLGVYLI